MINAIFGRPGGGKSYEATKYFILPSILKDRRKVVTNVPIDLDYVEKVHGLEYADLITVVDGAFSDFGEVRPFAHPNDYLQYKDWRNEKGQGVLFVIDECHLPLGQTAKKEITEFYSMHRHYGFDIYLISQGHRKINRDIRDMIEISYNCAKMEALGASGYNRKTYHGLPSKDFTQMEQREYDKSIFPYYKSHTASNTAVEEASAKGSSAVVNPYKKVTFVVIFLGIIGVLLTAKSLFSPDISDSGKPIDSEMKPEVLLVSSSLESLEHEQSEPVDKTKIQLDRDQLTKTQLMHLEKLKQSEKYHPFNKVQLHIDGVYWDDNNDARQVFFSASGNGQRLFSLSMKELMLAGYQVNILGDCIVEIVYYDFQNFIVCDVPTVGTSVGSLASN